MRLVLGGHRLNGLLWRWSFVSALSFLCFGGPLAQELNSSALIDGLRGGGYVIVMRHADAPFALPDASEAEPDNINGERQLSDEGKLGAKRMGEALTRLSIPIVEVLSSPMFRAMQTSQELGFSPVTIINELAELPSGFPHTDEEREALAYRVKWLDSRVAEPLPIGTNLLIITHLPVLSGAFGRTGELAQGESLVIRAENGNAVIVGQVQIDDWSMFDAAR